MPKTKEQCEQIREQAKRQIIEAAIRVFAYKGFAATKISDIAKEAHTSVGALYHYFSSKEELFCYIVEETVELSNKGLLYLKDLSLSPGDKIKALAKIVTQEILANEQQIPRFMMMVQAGLYCGEAPINQTLYKEGNIPIEITTSIIKEAQEEGTAKEGHPYMLASLFFATLEGLCMQKLVAKEYFVEPSTEAIAQLLLK